MNTLILRTIAPLIVTVMVIFSVFILLRGHNAPGGGFIGGLIAASAIAIHAMAFGTDAVRKSLRVHPMTLAGMGVLIGGASGLLSVFVGAPFLTGLWSPYNLVGTPVVFDIGVYLAVFGTLSAVALALEGEGEID